MWQRILDFIHFDAWNLPLIGEKILAILLILLACRITASILRRMMGRAEARGLDAAVAPLLKNVVSYLVYLIGLLIILDIFGVNTASIIALLGAAGIAVGLALKDTLSNIAAGIVLLLLRPFKANDYIECGATKGVVERIGLFTTVLRSLDGIFISAPNSVLSAAPITNYTRNGQRRVDITVGIAYRDSIDAALDVLLKVAAEDPRILETPAPSSFADTLADSAVTLHLWAWTAVGNFAPVRWDMTKKVKEALTAAGISIPFPQVELTMVPTDSAAK